MAQLSDVHERGSRLRERCNSEGRVTIDGKLQTLQRRWSDVKEKISSKVQVVEGEIGEWSDFTKELDQRLTELRNADISLGAAIISTAELKVLEEQLAKVKVCFGSDVRSKLEFELYRGCCKSQRSPMYYDCLLINARWKFGDEVVALKLRCCHGQPTVFPLVTISTAVRHPSRPLARWKRTLLPVTITRFSSENLVTKLSSSLTQLIIVVAHVANLWSCNLWLCNFCHAIILLTSCS